MNAISRQPKITNKDIDFTQAAAPEKRDDYFDVGDPEFWGTWGAKLLFTAISLKFWGLVASMAVTTWMLILHNQGIDAIVAAGGAQALSEGVTVGLNGAQWVTFNVTIWTLLYGIKEVRKVAVKSEE